MLWPGFRLIKKKETFPHLASTWSGLPIDVYVYLALFTFHAFWFLIKAETFVLFLFGQRSKLQSSQALTAYFLFDFILVRVLWFDCPHLPNACHPRMNWWPRQLHSTSGRLSIVCNYWSLVSFKLKFFYKLESFHLNKIHTHTHTHGWLFST